MDSSKTYFFTREQDCESNFIKSGPYWHITTPGTSSEILFSSTDDFIFAINTLALASSLSDCSIIAFALMSNHIHFILSGSKDDCLRLFFEFKKRIKSYMSKHGRIINWSSFTVDDPIPVISIDMLRNEVVYVNRNGYVAINYETPYSYKWSSGPYYFGGYDYHSSIVRHLTYREKRNIFHTADAEVPNYFRFMGDMVDPCSFCDFEFGKSIFRDAHQYFNRLSKSFEAYSEIAKRLGDKVFLSDEEIYPATVELSRKHFNINNPKLLGGGDKIELAKIMYQNLNATSAQIRRILKLDNKLIEELFGAH